MKYKVEENLLDKFKVGEKLYCKETYNWEYDINRHLFIKDKYYTLVHISASNKYYSFKDEEGDVYALKLNEVTKHFLTLEEVRLMKLKKLQCIK